MCQKEGKRCPNKRDHLTKNPIAETRTECQARMGISLDWKTEMYKVVDLIVEHNHPLQPPAYVHMIRSHRNIIESQASQIDMAIEYGLILKSSYELSAKQAGGVQNLGYTRVDQKNYRRTKRKQSMKYGEAGALLMYFQQEAAKNPSVFYEFQMDIEEQITNIFLG